MATNKTKFDQLSEEALRLAKRKRTVKKTKLVEVQDEVVELKKNLDDLTNSRLSASQQ